MSDWTALFSDLDVVESSGFLQAHGINILRRSFRIVNRSIELANI